MSCSVIYSSVLFNRRMSFSSTLPPSLAPILESRTSNSELRKPSGPFRFRTVPEPPLILSKCLSVPRRLFCLHLPPRLRLRLRSRPPSPPLISIACASPWPALASESRIRMRVRVQYALPTPPPPQPPNPTLLLPALTYAYAYAYACLFGLRTLDGHIVYISISPPVSMPRALHRSLGIVE